MDLVGLFADRFPASADEGSNCRDSFADLRGMLTDNWAGMTQEVSTTSNMNDGRKLVQIDPDWLEGEWYMCNKEWSRFKVGWKQCKGTWPGKRGYTCGLWNTFHMLAAQSTDESALSDLQTVRSVISHFFDCVECRDHFMQVPVPEIKTRRDAQLWWWNAHNVVNRRVGKLEEMYDDGDPGYVKAQYPTEAECPKCRTTAASRARNLRAKRQLTLIKEVSAQGSYRHLHPGSVAPATPKRAALVVGATDIDRPNLDEMMKNAFASLPTPAPAPPPVPKTEVAVETVTIPEAVAREQWDLNEVVAYLDKHYGSPPPSVF